ncbi:hypothetical protein ColKHC_06563 [Colletotrichum higginsianum]|nr:hypothetical protein ColKHC_06563 [Colletotrichum higginsianum]
MAHDVDEEAFLAVSLDFVTVVLNVSDFEVHLAFVDAKSADSAMTFKWTVTLRCGRKMISGDSVESSVDIIWYGASDHDVPNLPFQADWHVEATKIF